jgi:predicted peptidase
MLKLITFVLIFAAILAGCSRGGAWEKDFVSRSVTVDGKNYQYRVRLPKDRDPNKRIAVMLFLHGSGSRGSDNIAQLDGFRWAIEPLKDKFDMIAVLPQCEEDSFWSAQNMAEYSLAALDQTVTEFNGDPERLYLVGFSLGGYGVWQIAAANPEKFAALVPVAGGVVGKYPINPRDRAAIIPSVGDMLESPQPYVQVARSIGQTPVWVFHGAKDESVPVEYSRQMIEALDAQGRTDVRYTEYPDDGHQIFGKAIAEPGLLEWLANQTLQKPSR